MDSPSTSTQRAGSAARSGLVGTIVAAIAFFDGVFVGAPIAVLAVSFSPVPVFIGAAIAVTFLSIACCSWVNRRWDQWSSGNGTRMEKRLESMRGSRLMSHPVGWIERGSDRMYALAAALANPILVAAFAQLVGGKPVSERRILLGSIAYAIPYAAMWTLFGLAFGGALRAA
jgi:hypothetical protein